MLIRTACVYAHFVCACVCACVCYFLKLRIHIGTVLVVRLCMVYGFKNLTVHVLTSHDYGTHTYVHTLLHIDVDRLGEQGDHPG